MPRKAAATSASEQPADRGAEASGSAHLDELLTLGRSRGHLSLAEVRQAFEEAGITPAQGRSLLKELAECGVSLADTAETTPKAAPRAPAARKPAAGKTAAAKASPVTRTTASARADAKAVIEGGEALSPTATKARRTATKKTTAKTAAPAEETPVKAAKGELGDDDSDFDPTAVEEEETEVSTKDLDDNTSVMGDSVHTYLKAIGRRQLLTAEQEVDLAKRIEAGLYAEYKLENPPKRMAASTREDLEWVVEDGNRAKAHMLEANLRLVVSVAKKYSDRGLSLLDVVQEGNLGLIRAVEKFDYSKGYKFSTYAMWWIRQAIQRGFADSARTIRLPVHVLELLSKLSRVERDMHQRLGREPTDEELAEEMGKSPDQVRELLRTSRQPISLDSTIGEDGETRIGDLIEDTDSPEASDLVDRQLMADQLRRALGVLSPREAKIMAMRFGLYDGTPRTLDEIGKHLGLTRERIRQLEKESLSKLRHPSNAQPLLDFAV
ncbi:RNA polymerase sigma factor [Actinocorallia longicatena]|uniref:RNA polymerase sigma factor n=1 Tax=Actinocorallia longicatena TaxID=111803 RepID=A0ABP6PXB6_9ACTN